MTAVMDMDMATAIATTVALEAFFQSKTVY